MAKPEKVKPTNDYRLPIPTHTGLPDDTQAVKDAQILVSKANWGFDFEFLFVARHPVNDAPLVGKIRYEHVEEIGMRSDPSMIITRPQYVQGLMDELWRAGLRPSEEIGYPGELKATQLHLSDMRITNTKLLHKILNDENTS